jgi:hypothetical protein
MSSTADYIRSPYLRKLYSENLDRFNEANRRGIAHQRLESMWPSTEKVEGNRQHVSPLGGVALPEKQKGRR